MKKICIFVSICLLTLVLAASVCAEEEIATDINVELFVLPADAACGLEIASVFIDGDLQRGCCSWHGGVCGCAGKYKKCCDGTTSPSCKC